MCDISVTWQSRGVNWTSHTWTMRTSLYWSVGVVDVLEWAWVLCGCCIQNGWVEQQICKKICIKFEHSSVETIQMIQKAFRDDEMSAVKIKVWHKCFKDDWESIESNPCSGRPAISRISENVERVRAAINESPELEADLGIPKTTVSEILT